MVTKKLCSNCKGKVDNDWMFYPYCVTKVN